MKRYLAAFLLILAFTQSHARKLKGYVIYNNQEKVEVLMTVPFIKFSDKPDYLKMQTEVTCLQHNKSIVVHPENALEISFTLDDEPIRMLSVENDLQLPGKKTERVFIKLEVDGAIRLFRSYEVSSTPGMYNSPTGLTTGRNSRTYDRYVLQRNSGSLTRLEGTSFKKDAVEFFQGCPDIVSRIEEKELKKEDLKRIVREFNSTCAKQ
jgi:hypothetical protein